MRLRFVFYELSLEEYKISVANFLISYVLDTYRVMTPPLRIIFLSVTSNC